jgi:bifunctional UDP-N-acetylglucosamine pyrophosphorylase/glucosamine-1-phosphate N-acetyltransferase
MYDNLEKSKNNKSVVLVKDTKTNFGYGRIVINENKKFNKIVEEVDCNEEEKLITLINTGVYCFKLNSLLSSLLKIDNNNNSGEYYLTQCIKIIKELNFKNDNAILLLNIKELNNNYDETLGINTIEQYHDVQKEYKKII